MEACQELDHEPGPGLRAKKKRRDKLMSLAESHSDWVVGFQDEVWWSRLAQPRLTTWSEQAMRLVAKARAKGDTEPKALACYGLLRADTDQMLLRFVDGRPVSGVTIDFLRWVCGLLARARKRVFVLVWDNASWHVSEQVRAWIGAHNREVKQRGTGVRILECRLPLKSPWLNPIEVKWMHGKRAIAEPTCTLTPTQLEDRVFDYYLVPPTKHLQQHVL
jgi:transposase